MLKIHESSTAHKKCYLIWSDAEIRLKTGKTVDCQGQRLIRNETTTWMVLTRLMHIALYLAENNMAFRGTSDKLYTPHNGKFLGLVQLLGKFDPVMQEHLRVVKGDISNHYCRKNIQTALIQLMGEKVKSDIISPAKKSKYYAILADCTPDISHVEQLSLTIRFVDVSPSSVRARKYRKPDELEVKTLKTVEPEEEGSRMAFFNSLKPHIEQFNTHDSL
nr:uncharacterized protein LOC111419012 [Onthophagus taurus]